MHEVFTDMIDRPVIITGCARSGTSLVAGIAHACGAWMGKVTGPTRWNKKGQFENEAIRDRLTKPYLQSINCDPMGQDVLPDHHINLSEPNWRRRVINVIHSEGYTGADVWAFKGAKACMIWPVWHKAFPEARWVIVRRDDDKIIDSCMRTSFMRKRKTRESWQEWVDQHKAYFQQLYSSVPYVYEVWSKDLVEDPLRAKPLVEAVGLHWDHDEVMSFVSKELWHG